jgi:hypothetical protein
MAADLKYVQQLLDHDKPHDAWRSLRNIDARYGGIASAEIVEFEQRIGTRR